MPITSILQINLIFILFAAVVIFFLVVNFIKQSKITKALVTARFYVKASVKADIYNNKRYFSIIVSNRSMSDAMISAFGVQIGAKRVDFSEIYKAQNNIAVSKITVPARSFVELYISVTDLEKLVKLHILRKKPEKVSLFVIDAMGIETVGYAKEINKIIMADYKDCSLGEEKLYENVQNSFSQSETYQPSVYQPEEEVEEEVAQGEDEEVEETAKETEASEEVEETETTEEEPVEETESEEEAEESSEEVEETEAEEIEEVEEVDEQEKVNA